MGEKDTRGEHLTSLAEKLRISEGRLFSTAVTLFSLLAFYLVSAHDQAYRLFTTDSNEVIRAAFGFLAVLLGVVVVLALAGNVRALRVSRSHVRVAALSGLGFFVLSGIAQLAGATEVVLWQEMLFTGVSLAPVTAFGFKLLAVAVAEEFFFRGVLYWWQTRVRKQQLTAILLVQGVVFSLFHFYGVMKTPSALEGALVVLLFALLGSSLALVRRLSGSVFAPVMAHFGWNVSIAIVQPGTHLNSLVHNVAIAASLTFVLLLLARRGETGRNTAHE